MRAHVVRVLAGVALLVLAGCGSMSSVHLGSLLSASGSGQEPLSGDTIVAGLKQALEVGTRNAVQEASKPGGYMNNPQLRIPLPEKLQGMAGALRKIGFGEQVDSFEAKMNEAAAKAAGEATPVFLNAIHNMSFADAKKILGGGDTAATDYFREKTSATLKSRYMPIITEQMQKLDVVKTYKSLEARYNQIPLVPKANVSVEDYVTERALNGLFAVLGTEEKKIREDPAARTTALLRRVFGAGGATR